MNVINRAAQNLIYNAIYELAQQVLPVTELNTIEILRNSSET